MIRVKERVMISMDMWIRIKEWAADFPAVISADLEIFSICFLAVEVADVVIRMLRKEVMICSIR
ncbi:hypothetical protein D3C78_1855760 [compost metagenome]